VRADDRKLCERGRAAHGSFAAIVIAVRGVVTDKKTGQEGGEIRHFIRSFDRGTLSRR